MTNVSTKRSGTARDISKAKKILRRADKKMVRMDAAGETVSLAKLKAEAYKLESMIAEADTRCVLHVTFCERIRARRKSLKLTQADIASRLKITPPSYSQIETGNSSPSLDTVSRVAEALGCKPIELLK